MKALLPGIPDSREGLRQAISSRTLESPPRAPEYSAPEPLITVIKGIYEARERRYEVRTKPQERWTAQWEYTKGWL
ncbi:unnamed protein product [Heligmosomoides polygyrus]|uniref:Chromo domain-containing protein n=1 Tax=Heligmosomoides polygyrus TaxID=6339 RepID=A0A183F314_HELPZ|nr:unnamed protein product [Heligmosomoides polygyrus]